MLIGARVVIRHHAMSVALVRSTLPPVPYPFLFLHSSVCVRGQARRGSGDALGANTADHKKGASSSAAAAANGSSTTRLTASDEEEEEEEEAFRVTVADADCNCVHSA